ncbi:MAG: lipid-A-disaccharide synthase [Crocinitomicaceae bacterium]|nr:lipid-A-disaccharide synthase [Crocinitomicaceae bacterium]
MSQNNPRLYIIAGEASGDLHGSNLLAALKEINPAIETRCWGGDLMKKEGATIVKHISELAFMGFVEVLFNLRTILKNIDFCKKDILEFKPDILVLIDYPGFNLRIAEWAKNNNILVHYYISPQVWAWKQSRVKIIKRSVDKMYTILPFENSFYEKFDYSTEYVGHPLLDEIEKHAQHSIDKTEFLSKNNLSDLPIIALLPGSRKQEIHVKLPIMLAAVKDLKTHQIVIAGAPNQSLDMYQAFESLGITIIFGQTYNLLSFSELAVVTSGTATLETALFTVPQVVCYKGSWISYFIARTLIKIKYISLVNLIMDKMVVKELIQQDCTATNIRQEIELLIENNSYRNEMITNYKGMRLVLGQGGASKKVAQSLLKTISKA